MISKDRGFTLNRASKELRPHGTIEFPCAKYSSRHTKRSKNMIPWHWHEELEIIYVTSGELKVKVPSKTFFLEKDDCIVINSNILHFAAAEKDCRLHSLVFSPSLISGNEESVFAKKYIFPLLSCHSFTGCYIKSEEEEKVSAWFNDAFEAMTHEVLGFEFIVRANLSHILLFLYKKFEEEIGGKDIALNQDHLRTKEMLSFIHENFSKDISLGEIAKAADISERECLRCFQKTIQLSPIQYLLKYRIVQGADMLLNNPADTISEIAGFCGFDSPSHFSKMFKRFYGCTPRNYRNSNEEQNV